MTAYYVLIRDLISDVCSSDLEAFVPRSLSHALFDQYEGWILGALLLFPPFLIVPVLAFGWLWALSNQPRGEGEGWIAGAYDCSTGFGFLGRIVDPTHPADPRFLVLPCNPAKIGRAAVRERVCQYV